jgi:F5/8 type C domain
VKRPYLLGFALCLAAAPGQERTIFRGDFQEVSLWQALPSAGVALAVSGAEGKTGRALRLDFDFAGHAGWAAARREVAIDLPENWELDFSLRGEAASNDLEIKLIDASGQNVWWAVRRDLTPPAAWTTLRLKKRHFSFAWGPAGGGEIRHVAALELTVTARSGGKGWIAIDELELTSLPPPGPPAHPPVVTASSSAPGFPAERAMDGDPATAWRSAGPDPAWIAIDFGERREFGGLTVQWEPGRFAARYRVETSDDRERWTAARAVEASNGGRNYLSLPESEARYVRLAMPERREGYGIQEIVVEPLSWSESPNAFFQAVARDAARGTYPRSFSGEQSYWTVAGVDGDTENALVGEDGAVEAARGSFSVEPFLFLEGQLLRWSDVAITHALEEGDLPIPRVLWSKGPWRLAITAFAFGPPGGSSLQVRYRVGNSGPRRLRGKLYLAVRPFQVNPPTQFLNAAGGVAKIRSLEWDGSAVVVDGIRRVLASVPPSGFGAAPFDAGPITERLATGRLPGLPSARDEFGYASGALAFDLDLAPGADDEVSLELPIHPGAAGSPDHRMLTRREARSLVARRLAACAREWRAKIGGVRLDGPPAAQPLLRTLRSNLAYVLVERDGPALRPGTRSYARSWIRDGALISAALLRLGQAETVRNYIEWFARYQDPDGRVPCCVDRRGADAVPENDSHGEFLFVIAEYWRFTRDADFLRRVFGNVERAVSYIDVLRQKRRTGEYRTPEKLLFFGLLPESISHEGYSAKPVHSYWDDFWALKGLKDATDLAAALGREDLRSRWAAIRNEFAQDLSASLTRTIASRGIDYVPGSAELADFDPTATTIALDPAGARDLLPQRELLRTFERYMEESRRRGLLPLPAGEGGGKGRLLPLPAGEGRGEGNPSWDAYTPYEIRTVGTFVRLGWRERAHELLDFFLAGRRPAEWNQWAEVVGRKPRAPRFVGDMPHAWVGADFIRSVLDLFAWERPEDGALVLASGIPAGWLRGGPGVAVQGLRTPHGLLDYTLRNEKRGLRFSVMGPAMPPGGLALRPPLEAPPRRVTVNGRVVTFSGEELVIRELPANVLFER